ncbi:MAG TPA: riboflavin kinase [Vitreimonas sp.]|nr:riboflavin kinase [Vitreimonas sp.]
MKRITPRTYQGKVINGEKVGRKIGFPTANLDTLPSEENLNPGVYFGECVIDGHHYFGLAYFGPRLIFGEVKPNFEIYLYDFTSDLYDQVLEVTLTHYLRSPMPFDSLAALQTQLEQDKAMGQQLIIQGHTQPH